MSSSNYCFLICIQVSQEAGQVVWYSHLFQNFPQFIVIYTVKSFGIVNEAEIDVFLELSCFFNDAADVGSLISGSSALSAELKPPESWRPVEALFNLEKVMVCPSSPDARWSLHWKNVGPEHTLILVSNPAPWLLDFTLPHVWLWVSDHTIVVISVIKIVFVQFFYVFLPPLLNTFCFC